MTGIALAMAGVAAFSFGTVFFRGNGQEARLRDLNFWQSMAGAAVLAPFVFYQERSLAWPSASSIFAIAYLALVVSIGGMALWFWLIKQDGPAAASSYHLLNPMCGLLLSWLFLGTNIVATDILGSIIIGIGLFMTMQGRRI